MSSNKFYKGEPDYRAVIVKGKGGDLARAWAVKIFPKDENGRADFSKEGILLTFYDINQLKAGVFAVNAYRQEVYVKPK